MFVHRRSVNKLAHCFIVVFWLLFSASSSATKVNVSMADTMEESMSQGVNVVKKMANQIETTYASLSPRNQLIASGLTGFVVSRMVVHSAIGALKVGLAAYVVSEALHYSGALDRVKLSDEQSTLLTGFKEEAMRQAANYRQQVHRRLNPGTIQTFVQRQRNMALGLAGGAFVGILL